MYDEVVLAATTLASTKTGALIVFERDLGLKTIVDAGVKLDHSVRTVDEAAGVAREDVKAALGLLDARHVAGDASLTARLREVVLGAWRRDARRRLPEVAAAVRERAERNGELAFLLEPDLKECRGGLRDVQAMTAAAAAWVVDPPGERVRAAAERLLDVRVELHRRGSRPSDRLVQQEQAPVAHRGVNTHWRTTRLPRRSPGTCRAAVI